MSLEDARPALRGIDVVGAIAGGLFGAFLMLSVNTMLEDAVPSSWRLLFSGLALYGPIVLTGWLVVRHRGSRAWEQVGARRVGFGLLGAMLPLALVTAILANVAAAIVEELGGADLDDVPPLPFADSALDVIPILLAAVVVAPLAEEFLFRGIVHGYLRNRLGRVPATLLSSAAFAVVHVYPAVLASLFVTGIIHAIVRDATDSLWPSITLHAAFNALALAVALAR